MSAPHAIALRRADPPDAPALTAAMRLLALNLEDPWRTAPEDVARHGFGPTRAFHAVIAEAEGIEGLAGFALFSAMFSSSRGAPGLYVSDLWVAAEARGRNLGRDLLAAAAAEARLHWSATWLKLSVHKDNPRAQLFYDRLGFDPDAAFETLTLEAAGVAALSAPD